MRNNPTGPEIIMIGLDPVWWFFRTFDDERSWPDPRNLIQLRLIMHGTIPRSDPPSAWK